MIIIEKLTLGELQTNCYLVWDKTSKECLVIDPADDGVSISEVIENKGLFVKLIAVTHGHFDHILGALELKLIYNSPFGCSKLDKFLLDRQQKTAGYFLKHKIEVPNFGQIDIDLDKINVINLGNEFLRIIKIPGHTPGSVGFYNQNDKWIISGDVIFKEGTGNTKTKYGSETDLKTSIAKIKALKSIIYPGHGEEFEL